LVDSSISTIGVTSNVSHGVQGAIVSKMTSALPASMSATPPVPSGRVVAYRRRR